MSKLRFTVLTLVTVATLSTSGCVNSRPPSIGVNQHITPPSAPVATRPPIPCDVRFVDVAAADGIRYKWTIAGKSPHNILDTIGNGCAFVDYDNSGNPGVLLVGAHVALYGGDGHGHFVDVSHAMGLDSLHGHFLGCAVGDYDNDGFDDLYLTGYHTGALLHNEHGKGFIDVSKRMGLGPHSWSTSAAFVDVDRDGYLDLYVADYVKFEPGDRQVCMDGKVAISCGPHYYKPIRGILYRNAGGKRFDTSAPGWDKVQQAGDGLGVAVADFDGSGRPGIAVANDELMTDLYRNSVDSKSMAPLTDVGVASGVFADKNGHVHAAMGIDWGDYDNDGRQDLFVTTYENETKCLYHNDGGGVFSEHSAEAGIEKTTLPYLSFGCKFLDADNDGWLDILIASGHVADTIAQVDSRKSYRQPTKFFHNRADGASYAFDDASGVSGVEALPAVVGRGLAVGDFDNDGLIDSLVVDSEGAPLLLHNVTKTSNHWLGLGLHGSGRSNRDAYGAVATVTLTDGHTLTRECETAGSYMSSSDKRVLFGLGTQKVKSISVKWPDGKVETKTALDIDRYIDWTE